MLSSQRFTVGDLSGAAWVSEAKYAQISEEDHRKHLPVAPEFILELMRDSTHSKTDRLR